MTTVKALDSERDDGLVAFIFYHIVGCDERCIVISAYGAYETLRHCGGLFCC